MENIKAEIQRLQFENEQLKAENRILRATLKNITSDNLVAEILRQYAPEVLETLVASIIVNDRIH